MGQRQGWAREQLRLEGKSWLPGGVCSESTSSIEYKGLQNSVSEGDQSSGPGVQSNTRRLAER